MKQTDDALDAALKHAKAYFNGLDARSVAATATLEQLRARLGVPLSVEGIPAVRVLDELVAATEGGHLGSAGGRFFAWVIGGALPSALGADWLTTVWDQNAALYACGPAAAVVEEVAGQWLKHILDLPRDASFAFTTGCQMAHMTCLAAARHAVLRDAGWNVESDGLFNAPRIHVLANADYHGSIQRALRYLGLGTASLVPLPTGRTGQIAAEDLAPALKTCRGPKIVILDAADLNIGAFDMFRTLIPMAKEASAWVHVDGAFGLWARASRQYRHLTDGIELADSWATDAHKWLNTPQDNGVAFVRDVDAHRGAISVKAEYISASGDARDQIDWTPDWTRRARGFAVYGAIRELGISGIEDLVARSCANAQTLCEGLSAIPGVELIAAPVLNQGLIRFLNPAVGGTAEDHDAFTDRVIREINGDGEAFFSGTTWQGRRAMRISICNWRTNASDVDRAIRSVRKVLAAAGAAMSERRVS